MSFPVIPTLLALSEFAPILMRWFGGEKHETIAKQVIDIAKNITGAPDKDAMVDSLSTRPDLLLQFQKQIMKMELKFEQEAFKERQNARAREVAFVKAGHRNIRADVMVLAAAIGLVGCLFILAFYCQSLPGEAIGIMSTVAGIFGSCLKDAYAFEFGSSRGSREKDECVAAAMMELANLSST